ncbi:hypothetical protein CKO28_17335 [Rhodovibrio sodomensis]|uniref:Secreted protein n=1 Tax=Rhodovibrio sodomensis TaxID=1088 RepID=A0ABS1DJ92_9PROT|nr:hypothetical protein [Rhodovibrio sodomensis]MBK1669803.1 hypothetical protein [Rhodovibrio sodomensis]
MRPPLSCIGAAALAGLLGAPAAFAQDGWPRCWRADDCPAVFLSVTTVRGDARLAVSRACAGDWWHVWGRADARETIRQWLDDRAATGQGSLCIPLHPQVDEIRVTPTGGHCGETEWPEIARANRPGPGAVLRRGYGGAATATVTGCHARIGNAELGELRYGGVALDFADGYVFGDSYADGYFYGVYDGFGRGRVRPFGATVAAISEFNTYHYRVEIRANGSAAWTWNPQEDRGR